ncbi:5-oxoprolinase subunit PxpB [Candidatus Sodalis endolongispinus]|uniref:5-oxoprolinase subunit PxpB n=1 Tax=Candidatus Sodalis endolongispinus TaxID=2812662 RepID=A0ABS5YDK4_9GAMM|nr:5-oxoprolinase subunit PxpB [Candidatus Sodalis endolongispinus]MBT9433023.1 5-oxoprolinase subunit PxpB [Candidatus Sodalis endolongispinus]
MQQSSTSPSWRILPIADQAVCVDFGEVIDEQINQRVTALAARVKDAALTGVVSLIPTYRALTVGYDSTQIRQALLVAQLKALLTQPDAPGQRAKCWTIPVSYGGDHGVDLAALAALHHLTPQQVISLHCAATYRVYMIGFMPGFAYLGGLDHRLHTPRRESPRLKTPAGSISIGGMQTAVGSVEAPSGWHLIGRTPVHSFVPDRETPFLFSAGDHVCFTPVAAADFTRLQAQPDYLPDWTWQ